MLTGFYMTRIFVLTFLGKARWDDDAIRTSPSVMVIPMAILALLSTVAGFYLALNSKFENWLEPVLGFTEHELPFPRGPTRWQPWC